MKIEIFLFLQAFICSNLPQIEVLTIYFYIAIFLRVVEFFSDMFEDRDKQRLRTPSSFDYSGLDTIVLFKIFVLKRLQWGKMKIGKQRKKIEMNKL